MKKILYLLMCSLLFGCAIISEEAADIPLPKMERRFISLRQVQPGMTRQEVKSVLALPIITGYELKDPKTEHYQPLTLSNPHRSEDFANNGKSYGVDFYLAGIKSQDDKVTDDELVPMVFLDDKLIGGGWDFLKKLKAE